MNNLSFWRKGKNGGSLAITLVIIFVLVTICAALLLRGANESRLTARVAESSSALWAAEAGLQQALWEYSYNNCDNMVHEVGQSSCNGDKTLAGTLNNYGDYDVTLDSTNSQVQSVGSVPSRTAANKFERRVKATLGRPAIFQHGMFAQGQVTLRNNSVVDAYNSAIGVYGGANIDYDNGNVGSNGTTAGIVDIDNNAIVWGNVSTGPGGTVDLDGTVNGAITHTNSIPLPAVVVPGSLTSLASGGVLSVGNNGTRVLNAGDYRFTNITLGNQSKLNINGTVRLYLTGNSSSVALNTGTAHVDININAGGRLIVYTDGIVTFDNNTNINTVSQKPVDFQVYSTFTGTEGITISNNSTTYAAVYAPQTDVNITNNAGFFGAVVGETARLNNNGEVHYDTSLATLANPFEDTILYSWQEF